MAVNVSKSGGIYIEISGDYTQLQKDLRAVADLSKTAGSDISKALEGAIDPRRAASSIGGLTQSLMKAQAAGKTLAVDFSSQEKAIREWGQAVGISGKQLENYVALQAKALKNQSTKAFTAELRNLQRLTGESDAAMNALAKSLGGTGTEFDKAAKGARTLCLDMTTLYLEAVKVAAIKGLWDGFKGAFDFATRYETLGVVVEQVGKVAGYSAVEIDKNVNALRRMGIAGIEARKTMTQLIQAQVEIGKSPALARIAQDAAVIGGMNSSEAFEKMVHGIQSAQTEVLRTIGINVNFEQSYRQLAAELGKTTSELTEQEKVQARVNAVMGAGEKIAGSYEAAMGTLGKQLSSMDRVFQDFGTDFGKFFVDLANASGTTNVLSESVQGLNAAVLWLRGEMSGLDMEDMLRVGRAEGLAGLREYIEGIEQSVEETQRFEIQLAALANKLGSVDAGLLKNELISLKAKFDEGALSVEGYRRSIADLMVMAKAGVGVIGDDLTGAQKIVDDLRAAYAKTAAGGKETKRTDLQGNLQAAQGLRGTLGPEGDKMIKAFQDEISNLDRKTNSAAKSAGAAIERTSYQAAQSYKDALNGLTNLTMRTAELNANLQGETLEASFEKINRQFEAQSNGIREARDKLNQDAKTWGKSGKLDGEAQQNINDALKQLELQERELEIQKELERELARRTDLARTYRSNMDYAGLIGDLQAYYVEEVKLLELQMLSASVAEQRALAEKRRIAEARSSLDVGGMFQTGMSKMAEDAQQRVMDFWEGIPESMGAVTDTFGNLFANITSGIKNAADAFSDMGKTFQNIANQIISDLANMTIRMALFGDAAGGLGGGGGLLGGLFGGGGTSGVAGTVGSIVSGLFGFAKGGAIAAPSLSAYSNSIVSSPTIFPFAKGGVGLMGEAGAEAIMPLTRTSTGDLGVQVDIGGNRGGGDTYFQMGAPIINIEYTAPEGSSPEADGQKMAESLGAQLRKELSGFVRQELVTQSRPGGLLNAGIGA